MNICLYLNNNDTVVEPLNSIDHSITSLSRQSSTLLVSLGAALPYYNHRLYSHTHQLYSLSLSLHLSHAFSPPYPSFLGLIVFFLNSTPRNCPCTFVIFSKTSASAHSFSCRKYHSAPLSSAARMLSGANRILWTCSRSVTRL